MDAVKQPGSQVVEVEDEHTLCVALRAANVANIRKQKQRENEGLELRILLY